jgi:branched-chain amino acid aminotransferase
MNLKYCIHNGNITDIHQLKLDISNRSFRFGDSVFETIRVLEGNRVPLLSRHVRRLKNAMTVLRLRIPSFFSTDYFRELSNKLCHENELKGGGRIRLTVFREGEGNYIPLSSEVSYVMHLVPADEPEFILNQDGYWVDIFPGDRKPMHKWAGFKTGNSLFYVMAGIFCSETGINECLILNEKGNICESLHSNIFLIKGDYLITPPLSEGCVEGVMREAIIDLAEKNRWIVLQQPVTMHHIYQADEMFLTNAIQGIRWVYKFRDKFFKYQKVNELFTLMKKNLQEA